MEQKNNMEGYDSDQELDELHRNSAENKKQTIEEFRAQIPAHLAKAEFEAQFKGEAQAEVYKPSLVNLDPLELLRQVEKMRQDGFDEATIRAAFEEVMGKSDGSFRKPLRRVLKTDAMQVMPTQAEINKMYEDRYAGIVDTESNDPSVALLLSRMKETKELKVAAQKVTFKQRFYRVVYFFLRRPLRFGISFLKALQDGQ